MIDAEQDAFASEQTRLLGEHNEEKEHQKGRQLLELRAHTRNQDLHGNQQLHANTAKQHQLL